MSAIAIDKSQSLIWFDTIDDYCYIMCKSYNNQLVKLEVITFLKP